MKQTVFISLLILLIAAMVVLAGCSKSSPETPPATPPSTPPPDVPPQEVIQGQAYMVDILGVQGFSPPEITVQKNDLVRWTNKDPRAKDAVITFQYENGREFKNSDIIPAQGTWEKVFTDSGTYTYWTIGYGVKGKVIVE